MWSVPAFESVGLSKSWSYLFTTYGYEDNASGSRKLVAIHYHMSIQASTTGLLVDFTTRRCIVTTGPLLFIIVSIVTAWV
ncbi:hypothetical protein IKE88_03460 [Candidatus Saccharibacteria bacterium]|nr:hypothetical protein [Candidatus Saccharibacteria bacterium]